MAIAATSLGLIDPFFKNMKTVLLFKLLINGLVCAGYLIDGGMSGELICTVAIIVFITLSDRKKAKETE